MKSQYTSYGRAISNLYDLMYTNDATPIVSFLLRLTTANAGRRVLELGVGTGRVAIPLATAGFRVIGVDVSPRMLEICRRKSLTADVQLVEGDMTQVIFGDETFDVILIVFNSLYHLVSARDQVACMRAIAGYLTPGGIAIIETSPIERFCPRCWFDCAFRSAIGGKVWRVRMRHGDQRVSAIHLVMGSDGIRIHRLEQRYINLHQLDTTAKLCGLSLRVRQLGWNDDQSDENNGGVVSVYELPRTDSN
jgi:SAM-dependent methyltransferase